MEIPTSVHLWSYSTYIVGAIHQNTRKNEIIRHKIPETLKLKIVLISALHFWVFPARLLLAQKSFWPN